MEVPVNVWDHGEGDRQCTMTGCTQEKPQFNPKRPGGWCVQCTRDYNREAYRRKNNVTHFRYEDDIKRGEYRKQAKKRCSKCCKVKTLQSFGDSHKKPDGLQSWCKNCFALYRDSHRQMITTEGKKQQVQFTGKMYRIPQRSILMRLRRAQMEHDNGLYPAEFIDPKWVSRLIDDGLVLIDGHCYKLSVWGVEVAPRILFGEYDYLTDDLLDKLSIEQGQD